MRRAKGHWLSNFEVCDRMNEEVLPREREENSSVIGCNFLSDRSSCRTGSAKVAQKLKSRW